MRGAPNRGRARRARQRGRWYARAVGIEALTHDLAGNLVLPETAEEWDEWVSASRTRNHVLGQPLLDWLDRYGEEHGFERDPVPTDSLLARMAYAFQTGVLWQLEERFDVRTILQEEAPLEERRALAFAEATFAAMEEAVPIIFQGSLRAAETRTYGYPDLLVRSDVLAKLFPNDLTTEAAKQPAPHLGIGSRHYCVVDIKFSTLRLLASGKLGNARWAPADKVQVFIYNSALGRLQGYLPPNAFLLGRGWQQTTRGKTKRVLGALDRLGSVANTDASPSRGRLSDRADTAVAWLRRMRREGHDWKAGPEPSVEELRPNSKAQAGVWSGALKRMADEAEDLTLPPVRPARIEAARSEWIDEMPAEFYVDFETTDIIFMVGCGHVEEGEWQFRCFIAERLTEEEEARVLDDWFDHMAVVRDRLGLGAGAKVFHWSHHERSALRKAFLRHKKTRWRYTRSGKEWSHPNWFDFYQRVMRAEPVKVRGAHSLKLKEVTNAMHDLGLVETRDLGIVPGGFAVTRVTSGLDERASQVNGKLTDFEEMNDIRDYNEVDCKAVMELVRYLRQNH